MLGCLSRPNGPQDIEVHPLSKLKNNAAFEQNPPIKTDPANCTPLGRHNPLQSLYVGPTHITTVQRNMVNACLNSLAKLPTVEPAVRQLWKLLLETEPYTIRYLHFSRT